MQLFPCRYDRNSPTLQATGAPIPYPWQPASPPARDLSLQWGLVMDGQAHPLRDFGDTLAHELGHVFGLRHRNVAGSDTRLKVQKLDDLPENVIDQIIAATDMYESDLIKKGDPERITPKKR